MESKKKVCKRCEKDKPIWARGLCKSCDMVSNPQKYKIERVSKEKAKKPKAKSISKLKTELDAIFSQYIRLRNADSNGNVACFTSGVVKHWKEQHCGHFQSRRHMATRWNERNCQVQSVKENIFNQGNQYIFGKNLDLKYGKGTADLLAAAAKTEYKINKDQIQEKIIYYTEKVKQLKEQKGL
jgi:tRNA nucleotidyltransferase/poly(A) polymerase